MTWLTWRQFRGQAAVALGVLVAIVVVLAVTGPRVVDLYDAARLPGHYQTLRLLGTFLIGVPAIIGAFWGAPLVAREYEAGTHRMVWTQSVTHARWLTVKLALVGAAAVIVTAAFSFAFTWWSLPFDHLGTRLGSGVFGQRGIVPVGYAVIAVVLGVTLGAVIRRTVPAMATTLVAFFVVRFGVQTWIRPHLLGTVDVTTPIVGFSGPASPRGGLIVAAHGADRAGHVLGSSGAVRDSVLPNLCALRPGTRPDDTQLAACAHRLGVHDVLSVHPASQFWSLQLRETAIFLVLTLTVGLFCAWWVRHRSA